MKADGATRFKFINTYSYYTMNPTLIGTTPKNYPNEDPTYSDFRSTREDEFAKMVQKTHAEGMKFCSQIQIMYDVVVKDTGYFSEEAKTSQAKWVEENNASFSLFGNTLRNMADKWCANNQDPEANAFWDTWFAGYEKAMVEYAGWCEKYDADMLIIGEYQGMPAYRITNRWEALMGKIRSAYSGKIAICANGNVNGDNYTDVKAIAQYFDNIYVFLNQPYSAVADPSIDAYKTELDSGTTAKLEDLYTNTHKKIFVIAAFNSQTGAGTKPWIEITLISAEAFANKRDFAIQARMYEALFRSLQGKPWVEGVFW